MGKRAVLGFVFAMPVALLLAVFASCANSTGKSSSSGGGGGGGSGGGSSSAGTVPADALYVVFEGKECKTLQEFCDALDAATPVEDGNTVSGIKTLKSFAVTLEPGCYNDAADGKLVAAVEAHIPTHAHLSVLISGNGFGYYNDRKIPAHTLEGCTVLQQVQLMSVSSVGDYAFRNCTNKNSKYAYGDGMTKTVIVFSRMRTSINNGSTGLLSIGKYAFSGCRSMADANTYKIHITPDPFGDLKVIDDYSCGGDVLEHLFLASDFVNHDYSLSTSIEKLGSSIFASDKATSTSIRYAGTKAQWAKISKASDWASGSSITKVVCSDGDIDL